jgi:AcrR family transcriptional regulator
VNSNVDRGRATRERVIRAATELFAANGYDGTSTEAVLQASGVSRGSLYHHFANKEALFMAVLEAMQMRVAEDLAVAAAGLTDAVDVLRTGCIEWVRRAGDPVIRQIMLIDGPAVLGWREFRAFDERLALGAIRGALTEAAEAGRIPPEHVDAFAHIVLATAHEIAMMVAVADDRDEAMRSGEAAVDEFLHRLLDKR